MGKISLLIISCLIAFIPLFGIELGTKPGVAYMAGGEVFYCDLDHQDTLQLTSTGHHVIAFALSPDKRFLAYSNMFKVVDEPGMWDSIVPQVPLCSIVMLDLKEQKIVSEIFPEEYEWLKIDHWINASQLLCFLSSGFSLDDWYLYDTSGRVDTLSEGGWDSQRVISEQPGSADSSVISVIRENGGFIHLRDDFAQRDTVIFKESAHIRFGAISPDLQSFAWFETVGYPYTVNDTMYSDAYHLYLKNLAANESKVLLDEKNSRYRRHDKICFSPDNSVISIDWFRGDHVDLYFLKKNQLLTIAGQALDWIDARQLMLFKENNLYIYDTVEKTCTLFLADIREPQYMH